MLQQPEGSEYVLATNETHTVRSFVENAGKALGMNIEWTGEGVNEFGTDTKTGKVVVKINPQFYRPAEVDLLIGDPHKAQTELGWKRQMSYEGLVEAMAKADDDRARDGSVKN